MVGVGRLLMLLARGWGRRMGTARWNGCCAQATVSQCSSALTCWPLCRPCIPAQVEGLLLAAQQAGGGGPAAGPGHPPRFAFRSTPQALVAIAQKEGWRALFAGLSINYMKARAAQRAQRAQHVWP